MIGLTIETITSIVRVLRPSYRRCVLIAVVQEVIRPVAYRIALPTMRNLTAGIFRSIARYNRQLSVGVMIIGGVVWIVQWTRELNRS